MVKQESRLAKLAILIMADMILFVLLRAAFIWINPIWGYDIQDKYGYQIVQNDPDFKLPSGFWVRQNGERTFTILSWDGREWTYSYTGQFLNTKDTPKNYYLCCAVLAAVLTAALGGALKMYKKAL